MSDTEIGQALARAIERINELEAELHEQARVNGMGSEREARLMATNAELVEALQLALSSYGVMKMGDPPQEAWDVWKVEEIARAALAKAQGEMK